MRPELASLLHEDRVFVPSVEFAGQANAAAALYEEAAIGEELIRSAQEHHVLRPDFSRADLERVIWPQGSPFVTASASERDGVGGSNCPGLVSRSEALRQHLHAMTHSARLRKGPQRYLHNGYRGKESRVEAHENRRQRRRAPRYPGRR